MFARPLTPFALALLLAAPTAANAEERVVAPPGTELGLPFSAGILAGDFLYLSGAIGNRPGTVEVPGGLEEQTRQTLANLRRVLDAAGLEPSRVVVTETYLADARLFPETAPLIAGFFDGAPPAGFAVEADVAIPGALVEMAMIAARPGVAVRAVTPEGWPGRGRGASWGTLAGDTLYVSGMASLDPRTGEPVPGDAARQTERALRNLGAVLEAAGLGYDDVVSCRVFLADARDYGAMNEAYGRVFTAAPPARATVRARLTDPRLRVEIACVAVAGGERRAVSPPGWPASGRPFSPAVRAGDRLFVSGMVGRGENGYPEGVEAQTRITLERLAAALNAGGLGFRDVAVATVFLSDIRHYAAMNRVYAEVVGSPPPARATVGTQLASPEALVEIQMLAVSTGSAASASAAPGDP